MRSYINGGCLERADLSGADLRHVVANKADLRRTRLHGCRLDDAELEEAHLDCVNMKNGSLSNARMARAGIAGSVIEVVDLSRAELVKARLNDSLLREISGPEVNFEGSILDGACFEGCKLPGARFRKARGRASFLACNLESCNGKEAKIAGSSFEGSSLVRAKFPKADLSGGSLVSADLSGGDFTEANLSNVDWRMPVSVEGLQIWGARFANRRDFEKHIRDEQWLSEFRESARFSRNPVLWAWRILWFLSSNYGRSPSVLFLWAVLFILGFAVVYHGVNYGGFLPPGPGWATWPVPADKAVVLVGQGKGLSPFLESVHLSVDIFTNLGVSRVEALTPLGACLVWTEALIGWITLGSLLSVIANIVLRRS